MQLLLTIFAAVGVGLLARRLRLPGGVLVGAMIGSATVSMLWGQGLDLPLPFEIVAFALVGMTVGVGVTRRRLAQLAPYAAPAVLSALALIAVGYLSGVGLNVFGAAPPAAALATSPGALSVLAAVAVDHGDGAVEVALFHLVRLVVVIMLLPVILRFRPNDGR